MLRGKIAVVGLVLTSMLASRVLATDENPDPYANETTEQRDARMKWWREARFGMFIHWGVYSVPAGTYHGKKIDGIGEWIMNSAKIPCAEYQSYAKEFNPTKYNPREWVKLAKEAGMKYIVITSKHHDGFALFATKASKWNVVDATPYGKDLLKPLAEACAKEGIRLGFYYSQAQDWNNPGGAAAGGRWDKAQEGDMTAYVRDVAVTQVREILSNYGPIAVLWWDTPVDMTKERADMLIPLLKLQPGIIHNNRLGVYEGDTETPEQSIPPTGFPGGRDWETCMTMNDTWGFKSYDDNWKSVKTIIQNLVDIASKGGNYLLNVGPTNEGLIPQPSIDRLKEVGKWMQVNGEAIYATSASPFRRLPWGRCTKKVGADGTTLYLHVFDWPKDGKLFVPGLKNKVQAVSLLADAKTELKAEPAPDGAVISIPPAAPDPICSVIVCRIEGRPDVAAVPIAANKDGIITLPADEATIKGQTAKCESIDDVTNIGFWTDPADAVEWTLRTNKVGTYEVTLQAASPDPSQLNIVVGGKELTVKLAATGDFHKFALVTAGRLELTAGVATLTAKPVKDGWKPINLRSIELRPVP